MKIVKEDAKRQNDAPVLVQNAPGSGDPGVAWIHSLAGEWQSRWERAQNPQDLSGASLLK